MEHINISVNINYSLNLVKQCTNIIGEKNPISIQCCQFSVRYQLLAIF